jgi:glucosamine--fructose-6-phosphate aminotransferase (isomerizing)
MCGIFGCIKIENHNEKNNLIKVSEKTYQTLYLLKNRGYDSCGIFLYGEKDNITIKLGVDGEIIKNEEDKDIFKYMENKITNLQDNYNLGIGHTRWATHGVKNDLNAHPHKSSNESITLVHNGIISNCEEIKLEYLQNYKFSSNTDTEIIANLLEKIELEEQSLSIISFLNVLERVSKIMVGTWACIIFNSKYPNNIFWIKNESPLLIGKNDNIVMLSSEPSGFLNMIDSYFMVRDKSYGFIDNQGIIEIKGNFKKLDLFKSNLEDVILPEKYNTWMEKEIDEQKNLNVLIDPLTNILRYQENKIELNLEFISKCKYLYIIACGSSYYAGLIASNYFRYTKAFEFVNVFDAGEFNKAHLESIDNPEEDLLVLIISQSGETRDLNIATTICREYSSNRKNNLEPNTLLKNSDPINVILTESKNNITDKKGEIKIIGIINVIGSLLSRRTVSNIYTNCGRENSVASTKSCTSQILACLLLAIYKSQINNKINTKLLNKFLTDLNSLKDDIEKILDTEYKNHIKFVAINILKKLELNKKSMFLLGKDELYGCALEGALKIKEIAYIHSEGFNISALKHGPYALIENNTPIILIYKEKDHFVKSIIEETKTRGAYVIEISAFCEQSENSIKLPNDKTTFSGLLSVIVLQILAYYLSIEQKINPDQPRNLAKVVTVD